MEYDFNEFLEFFNSLEVKCAKTIKHSYKKNETITTYIENRQQVCIMLKGEADLIRYDYNGNKTIIGHFSELNVFGEVLYPANTNNELFVQAKSDCEVLFFSYSNIWTKCKTNCPYHKDFSEYFNKLIITKVINLNTRVELLTKKNIRDKLLSYFNILSGKQFSRKISIPFSYTDLADYLGIDRSAMMREISHLEEEHQIEKNGKNIKLLYE